MERNDGKVMAIVALFIGVIGLSIGFAALNTQLNINGSASVQSSTWDVHFENLQQANESRDGIENTAPSIDSKTTSITGFDVTLMSPGDTISYEFDVVNEGDYEAEITAITIPTPTCTGSGANATTDAENVCKHLSYTLKYKDGGATVAQGDTLAATNGVRTMVLTLAYSSNVVASELPKNDVTVTTLAIPITYSQK